VNRNDFNGDGLTDIVFQHFNGALAVWFMNGNIRSSASFLNPPSNPDPDWRVVGSSDFNGDNRPDLLFQYIDGSLAAWFFNGTNQTSTSFLSPSNPGADWRVVGIGDFNADGKRDLLFRHGTTGALAVWYMDGINRIGTANLSPASEGLEWVVVAVADVNTDGRPDIVFRNLNTRILAVWLMNGVNRVDADLLNPADPGVGWIPVAVGQFDSDPQLDLILQSDNGDMQLWRMRGLNAPERVFLNPVNAGSGWIVVGPN
jgi:hypothetical protein